MDVLPAVLVVDDFRTMTEIICKLLGQIGFTDIDRARNGPSALEHLRTNATDSSSQTGKCPMSGPQLIEEMRRDPVISNIPVVLVTAKYNQDHSWLAGGDGYIVKPFIAQSLREKIDEVLLQHRDKVTVAG